MWVAARRWITLARQVRTTRQRSRIESVIVALGRAAREALAPRGRRLLRRLQYLHGLAEYLDREVHLADNSRLSVLRRHRRKSVGWLMGRPAGARSSMAGALPSEVAGSRERCDLDAPKRRLPWERLCEKNGAVRCRVGRGNSRVGFEWVSQPERKTAQQLLISGGSGVPPTAVVSVMTRWARTGNSVGFSAPCTVGHRPLTGACHFE